MLDILAKRKELIILILILLIASFFRLWQLNSIPPGLYPDVALNGNEALKTLKTGDFKVFYPENNGREGLMMWLIALSFSVFGVSVWSIKIVAASAGILTVLGVYLLTKELFNNPASGRSNSPTIIALLSGFFLATSFWHTNFSRIGFRAILLPFILVFSFYFLFKGLNIKKIWPLVLAGIFFGLGFYTYTPFRLAVLILPFVFIPYWFIYKKTGSQKKLLFSIFCFLFSVFLVALPIGVYFLRHSQDFISRATGVSIFAQPNPIKTFAESLIKHLGMFNFVGDQNWRHNFSGSPMLPWSLGILFLIGIIFSVKELISSVRGKNYSRFSSHIFLISWFFVMLLPGALTFEGIPHSLRVVGVIPVVYIFTALGAYLIYQWLQKIIPRKKILYVLFYIFLILAAFGEFNKYFFVWAKNPNVEGAFAKNYAKIGEYLNSLPDGVKKYVVVNEGGVPVPFPNGLPMPAQTPMFIERTKYGEPRATYLLPEDLNKIKDKEDALIIFMQPR